MAMTPVEEWLNREAERYAKALFGAVPAGKLFGMSLFISYDIPNDRIRIVDPNTGAYDDIPVPGYDNPPGERA